MRAYIKNSSLLVFFGLYVLTFSIIVGKISDPSLLLTEMPFWFGPEVQRILDGRPLENANRMPFVPHFLAALSLVYNEQMPALLLKNFLYQLLLAFVLYRWWHRPAVNLFAPLLILYVLFFPQLVRHGFSLVPEEGYLIAMLAFAFHGLLIAPRLSSLIAFLPYAAVCAILFLTKESMLVLSPTLCLLYFLRTRRFDVLILFAALVMSCMLLWGFATMYGTGQFSLTTNNAGREIWKGNNPRTLELLPHATLDPLSRYAPRQEEEEDQWEWSRRCRDEAVAYVMDNPDEAVKLLLVKLYQVFVKITAETSPSWSASEYGFLRPGLKVLGIFYMLIFRLLFFAALIHAALAVLRKSTEIDTRSAAICYLLFIAAFCLPFLVAWGTERRLMPMVVPTVLYILYALEIDPGLAKKLRLYSRHVQST